MNKKLLLRYILLYLPFLLGIVMFSFNIVNLFSSLLLFLGGYIAIKNTFDYRMIRKNVKNSKVENNINLEKNDIEVSSPMVKRRRGYERVRKRTKQ